MLVETCGRMIGFDEAAEGARLRAEELPPFRNDSKCAACGNQREIRVHYSPGSRDIDGLHFRRICSACGARWTRPLLPELVDAHRDVGRRDVASRRLQHQSNLYGLA